MSTHTSNTLSKVCSRCNIDKELREFCRNKHSKDGHYSICRSCRATPVAKYTDITSKVCSKCREDKEITEFHKNKRAKDGYYSTCKSCKSKYTEANRARINKINTAYKEKNRDQIRSGNRGYYRRHKSRLGPIRREYNTSLCKSARLYKKLKHLAPRWSDAGHLIVPCYKCGKYFAPTNSAAQAYIQAFKGDQPGERNLYCSDRCKQTCSVFGQSPYRSHLPPSDIKKARSCQTNHLKLIQCDEDGHTHCEKCGDIIDVELHHTLPVAEYGLDSISSAGHILLCWRCHQAVTC